MTPAASRPSTSDRSDQGLADTHQEHAGPERTLADLVHRHLDFVWRLLTRLGLSSADAEDAAQHVLLVAADKLDCIEQGKARTFLYGVALRVAANVRRGERRRRRANDASAAQLGGNEGGAGDASWPDELTELGRARALCKELLARLPDELARVLVLAEVEQCTVPEIAELERLPVGTAASRLRRARAAFRELLAREAPRNPFAEAAR